MSLIILFLLNYSFTQAVTINNGQGLGTEDEGFPSTPVTESAFYTPATDKEPATITVPPATEEKSYTKLDGDFTGTVKTDYGETSGTFSNMIVGNGGIYEATITGIAAGATMYFLSSFDAQLFKFTAGKDKTSVRVVQFQKDGSSQNRIYMELAKGDSISQGEILKELQYHFKAEDSGAVYIYNQEYGILLLQ